MKVDKKNMKATLDELHNFIVGNSNGEEKTLTDLEKIIGILEVFSDKLDELDGHSHTIN